MKLVDEFKALADKTRVRIIGLLLKKKLCVCEIMDILEMAQSRISRHLGILKQAGLIEEERRSKWVIYRINNKHSLILSYIQQQLKNELTYTIDVKRIKKALMKKLCPISD